MSGPYRLRCTQVEVAEWTSVFWYKKKDGHQGILPWPSFHKDSGNKFVCH